MKKFYFLLIAVCCFTIITTISAQEPRYVVVEGYELGRTDVGPDDFNNVLYDAIKADTIGRSENPNTIYVLKRNHIYQLGKRIENNFHLQIQAEEGDGYLPELAVGLRTDGTTGSDFFYAYDDLTLKNIYVNGNAGSNAHMHRVVELRGAGMRFIMDGCAFSHDRSGAIVMIADSVKAYVSNSVIGNLGYNNIINGNGRLVDCRGKYNDTVVVKNTYGYSMTDRIIRNHNSTLNYLELDHVTILNTVGRHGGIQLGNVKTAKITNNVFANVISNGHTDANADEQTQADKHFAVVSLDTIYDAQSIEIRNNNIYWDQAVKDVWALFDSVEAPNFLCSTVVEAIGSANVAGAYFTEPLEFNTACGDISAFVAGYYTEPNSTDLPNNWCVGGDDGYYYDEFDVSYADTYDSYTADDDGNPVGCQLHFDLTTAIKSKTGNNELTASFYPNPFETTTNLKYTLSSMSNVKVTIYDITGSEVQVLVNEFQNAGEHLVDFNAGILSSGMYFYKLEAGTNTVAGKLVVK